MHLHKMALPMMKSVIRTSVCYSRKGFNRSLITNILSSNTRRHYSNQDALVETEKVGHVFMVGINRPESRNCVNPATALRLSEAFTEFECSEDLWVAVLYGKGGCFCSGYDLKALSSFESTDFGGTLDTKTQRPMGPTRMVFSKPVIAAISGYAVAGGLELALMCDMRVVEQTATMGIFCRRWGVPLLDGGTVRLQKLIGLSQALDLTLTGRPVLAAEAQQMGLANRVVPPGSAVGEAVKLARVLCTYPQACLRADRRSAYHAAYDAGSEDDAFTYEWENGKEVLRDAVKGAQRFTEGSGRHGSFNDYQPPKAKL